MWGSHPMRSGVLVVAMPWQRCCIRSGRVLRARLVPLVTLLVCLAGVWCWCPFRLGVVRGSSMYPTMRHGQIFLLQRGYYKKHPFQRGDVVVLRVNRVTCVKRVYAVGGDVICELQSSDSPTVLVDPERYPKLVSALRRRSQCAGTTVLFPMPEDSIFVLGDNIGVSCDSRHFGLVTRKQVVGRVLGVGHGEPAPAGVIMHDMRPRSTTYRL